MDIINKISKSKWISIIVLILIFISLSGFNVNQGFSESSCDSSFGDIALDDETYQKLMKPVELDRALSLPFAYDARNSGIVTSAKDQGDCGCCWSFTSVGAFESHLLKEGYENMPIDLSEQQQCSCNDDMEGCCGGSMTALRYWETIGQDYDSCYPYGDSTTTCPPTESVVACKTTCPKLPYRISNFHTVASTQFKESLFTDGPSYFRFDVYEDFSTFWNSSSVGSVYTQKTGELKGGHAILLIGWDDSKGAYLFKNSWGQTGGPQGDGTFWMAYSGHTNDLNFQMANFDVYTFEITKPSGDEKIYAGSYSNPQKIVIHTNKPYSGLSKSDFKVQIGSQNASIITLYEGSDNYVLEVLPSTVMANGVYDLTVEFTRGSISDSKVGSIVFADTSNVDVDLVIDRSGSMAGTPITLAKQAASQFVDYMHTGDKVGVISFSSSVTTDYPLTTIVDDNIKSAAKTAINAIVATGSTSIGGGLQRAQEQLTTLGDPNHPWAIVLLTDGYENYAPYVATVLPAIVDSKTVVHTVGLGSANQAQLLDIATQTGGTYNYAPTPDQLAGIYSTISGAVSNQQTLFEVTGDFDAEGFTEVKEVVVDSTISAATFSVTWTNSAYTIDMNLEKPDGTIIYPSSAEGDPNIEWFLGSTYQYFRIKQPTLTKGVWKIHIVGATVMSTLNNDTELIGDRADTYTVKVTADSALTMQFFLDKETYMTYEPIKLIVTLSDSQPITNATVIATITPPSVLTQLLNESEWIEINGDTIPNPDLIAELETLPDDRAPLLLYDDGLHGDGSADDGVYANVYNGASEPGTYTFSVSAEGKSSTYDPFTRLAELSTYIAENPDPPAMWNYYLPLIANNYDPTAFTIVPDITSPADGEVVNSLIPTLSWQVNSSLHPATWFYYWVSSDPDFSYYEIAYAWESAYNGSTKPSWNLEPDTTYYWYAAYDYIDADTGYWEIGPTTPVRSFRTGSGGTILPAPTLISPSNGSTGINTFPIILDWNPVAGALEYEVQLWFECDPPYWCYYRRFTTDTQLSYPNYYFDSNTYYEWVVIPRNDYAWGNYSDWWSFTTGTVPDSSVDRDQIVIDHLFYIDESGAHIPYSEVKGKGLK